MTAKDIYWAENPAHRELDLRIQRVESSIKKASDLIASYISVLKDLKIELKRYLTNTEWKALSEQQKKEAAVAAAAIEAQTKREQAELAAKEEQILREEAQKARQIELEAKRLQEQTLQYQLEREKEERRYALELENLKYQREQTTRAAEKQAELDRELREKEIKLQEESNFQKYLAMLAQLDPSSAQQALKLKVTGVVNPQATSSGITQTSVPAAQYSFAESVVSDATFS